MKYLTEKNYYLKSVNVIGGKNIFLFFRQEGKYILRDTIDNQYDYINVSLVLWMESEKEANFLCEKIKQLFLDTSLTIELISENKLMFIGDYDYTITVKKYDEDVIDQFVEDWIDRYLAVTKMVFDRDLEIGKYFNLLDEINTIVSYLSDDNTSKLIKEKFKIFEKENKIKLNFR